MILGVTHCRRPWRALAIVLAGTAGLLTADSSRAEIEFAATWQPGSYANARSAVERWADAADLPPADRRRIAELWPANPEAAAHEADLLERVAQSLAVGDRRAAELVAVCRADYSGPETPDVAWLAAADVPPFQRANLRLYYARWLAQYGLYDEVLQELSGLSLDEVVDPASVLFYRMIAHQQLVQPDEARAALVQLLEHKDALPQRFQQVAQLLERDLSSLSDESLDHIARRMSDIRRRLAYGRTGEHVQEIERGVVQSLDRKIKQLEQQQQQQQSQAQASGQSQPSQPMQDSRLQGMSAPMHAEPRGIGEKSGWGDLPPREREQALQQIGREFPAHYRDIIEQYFRELAAEQTTPAQAP
ncbi:MAG TPA: hypothetical protein VEQ85_11805 [Lacipirellulaceae bacterium]|nr:hypothetical protein [Lacipirellulaceae bacterium]